MIDPRQLIAERLREFDILVLKDLGDYLRAPPNQLRKDLKSYRKDNFQDKERVVFYATQDCGPDIINYMEEQCELMDFPTFFIIIVTNTDMYCGPFNRIKLDLPLTTDAQHTNFNIPKTVCIAPWVNSEINVKGEIRPCCLYNKNLGDITQSTISEVFNGEEMQQLRASMLKGELPRDCSKCWNDEKVGKKSMRMSYAEVLDDMLDEVDFTSLKSEIRMLDIKTSYTCNLKCRICNLENSSSWMSEVLNNIDQFPEFKGQVLQSNLTPWLSQRSSMFWQDMDMIASKLQCMIFAGGEPLLDKSHVKLLKQMIANGNNANIDLNYNTNGAIDPSYIFDTLDQFKSVTLSFSIDNVGAAFEYERHGQSWQQVDANIRRIIKLRPDYNYNIWQTVSVFNVDDIDTARSYASDLGIEHDYGMLDNPWEFCIDNMPMLAKAYIIEKRSGDPLYAPVVERLRASDDTYDPVIFWKTVDRIDGIRGENFRETNPISRFF